MKKILPFLAILCLNIMGLFAQTIQSFSPSTGNAGEMINVTITGQNTTFQQGTDVIQLTNGSTVISPVQSTFVNDSLIQSVIAFNKDHPTGYYNLSIHKNGGTTLYLNNCFNLSADPTIASVASVNPSSSAQGSTVTLTITGLNTNFGTSGAPTTIWLQQGPLQINGSNIVVIDSLTIQAQFTFTYGNPVGSYDVYFYNILNGTVSDAGGFLLNTGPSVPAIVSCLPSSGTQGEFLTVSITGQNTVFQQGTDVIRLTNGTTVLSPQQSTFVNDSLIQSLFVFSSTNPTGNYSLSIQKGGIYTLNLYNCFYLNPDPTPPSIVSVTPSFADQGTTVTLTITGLHTNFDHIGTTTTTCLKQGTYQIIPISTVIIDSITIQAQFAFTYGYPTGLYNICATNTLDGSLVLTGGFTLNTGPNPPTITTVSPNIGLLGETLMVSITGQNTIFEQGTDNINLSQGSTHIYPTNLSFVSTTLLNATFTFSTSLPTGYYDVNITGDDLITLTNGFNLLACSAQYTIVPDTAIPHHYYFINNAAGIPPLIYLWSWGDGTFDSIAYPSHLYSAAGNYTICLAITDSVGCTSTYCDTSYLQKSGNSIISVDVIAPGPTGINNYEFYNQIKIYPNPTKNNITIESPLQACLPIGKAVIEILNMQGQLIRSFTANSNKTNIDISAFPSGMYVVKVKTEKGVAVKKFVKE